MKKSFIVIICAILVFVSFFTGWKLSEKKLSSVPETTTREDNNKKITAPDSTDPYYTTEESTTTHTDCKSIYHGSEWNDLFLYNKDETDEAIKNIQHIHSTEYYSMGSSLKHFSANVSFMELAYMDESQWTKIPAHLDKMTPLQLDFLSFRINETYEGAIAIAKNPDYYIENYAYPNTSIDLSEFKDFDVSKLVHFYNYMLSLFNERNVDYEWMTSDDCTFFFYNK